MQALWIIVDGYSLLHRTGKPGVRPGNLQTARQHLVRKLEEVAGALAERITVVFDGAGRGGREGHEASSIEVVFSPSDKTADTVIERMVHESGEAAGILVVTSDRMERETTAAAGADTMSCGDFLELCERTRSALSRQASTPRSGSSRSKLGDFFPD
jgi:uncharacterized protein